MALVWLLLMNLAVIAWWAMPQRAARARIGIATVPSGMAVLERVEPVAVAATHAVSPATDGPVPGAPAVGPEGEAIAEPVCVTYGPYRDEAEAGAARGRLPALGATGTLRRVAMPRARGYTVSMPPLGSREAALATAERLRAAGFQDLMVIGSGEQANGIALGRFGSEDNARRHQAALQEKGFAARIAAVGDDGSATQYWLDVRAPAGFDADARRPALAAAQARTLRCEAP